MKKTLLFILLSFFSTLAISQVSSVTIGNSTGPGSWFYGPIYRNTSNAGVLNYSRHAYIYTNSELGIPSGSKILKIEWLKKDGGTIAAPNIFDVFIKNISATSYPSSTPWSSLINGSDSSFSSITFPLTNSSNTWFSVPIDSFTYTGSSLQILTNWKKTGIQTGSGINYYSLSAIGKSLGITSSTEMSETTILIPSTYGNYRPTIKITYYIVPPCNGSPNFGNVLSSIPTVCPSESFTLSTENMLNGTGISYVWQKSNSVNFSNFTIVGNSASLTTMQDESFYYRCIASCTASNLTYTSNPIHIPMNFFYECYCSSAAISSADEEVFNFKFGLLNNSSDCSTILTTPGSLDRSYSNYKNINYPTVEKNSLVPFSISIGTCLNNYQNKTAIYIDYNHNAIFESSELVYHSPSLINGAHTEFGNVTISDSALSGVTGLRVIVVQGNSPIYPCGYYSWGETEDYLVNIVPTTICNTVPDPGNTIADNNTICANTNTKLSLEKTTYGSNVTYQWYKNNVLISGATSFNYITENLNIATSFYCKVRCGTLMSNSIPVTISMTPFIDCYCLNIAGNNADEDILSFTLNSKISNSDCENVALGINSVLGRYSNFMNFVLDSVDKGQLVTFDINQDDCDIPPAPYYSFGTGIWIDYNHDGLFDNVTEKVFVELSCIDGPRHIIGSFSIPLTAKTGETGLRISIKEGLSGNNMLSCGMYGFGETEDYKIYINGNEPIKTLNLKLYIQGYYDNAGLMKPVLFNENHSTNSFIVDTIEVKLMNKTFPFGMISSKKVALNIDGTCTVSYPNLVTNSYYIAIDHRNAIETWSSSPVSFSSNTINYNFTTSALKSYGNNMIEIDTNKWAFYSGDIDSDENIDILDLAIMENDVNLFLSGYITTDINGDGSTDIIDMGILENNINKFIYSEHP